MQMTIFVIKHSGSQGQDMLKLGEELCYLYFWNATTV